MNEAIRLEVEETFTITGRGIVALLNGETDLGVGKPYKVEILTPEGKMLKTEAFKEWLLRKNPEPIEKEGFLLMNLSKKDVPIGSVVTFIKK